MYKNQVSQKASWVGQWHHGMILTEVVIILIIMVIMSVSWVINSSKAPINFRKGNKAQAFYGYNQDFFPRFSLPFLQWGKFKEWVKPRQLENSPRKHFQLLCKVEAFTPVIRGEREISRNFWDFLKNIHIWILEKVAKLNGCIFLTWNL